jgi:hypothetical protein
MEKIAFAGFADFSPDPRSHSMVGGRSDPPAVSVTTFSSVFREWIDPITGMGGLASRRIVAARSVRFFAPTAMPMPCSATPRARSCHVIGPDWTIALRHSRQGDLAAALALPLRCQKQQS